MLESSVARRMRADYLITESPTSPETTVSPASIPDSQNSVRKIAFYFAITLTFIRCSTIHELITYKFNVNVYLLYAVGIPTILGILVSKSLLRPFRFRPAYYWLGFALWITIAVPFSIWKGGSLHIVNDYWRTNVILIFALGGLVSTWEEFETLLRTIALSCLVNLAIIRVFGQMDQNGRMYLPFGAVANSNDYAAHLLMLLPSLLWVALVAKSFTIRIATLVAFCGGLYAILASASRGALIAVIIGIIYYLFSVSIKQRITAIAIMVTVLAIVFSLMPGKAIQRIVAFSKGSASAEALRSSDIRSHLLQDSIWYALTHPVFGLGPGNFSTAEGKAHRDLWEPAHNSFATVASECGFPALILFIGGIGGSFAIFRRVGRETQGDPRSKDLNQAAFCMRLMILAFCTAI